MFVEGEFLDTVIGIPGSRIEIVMLRPPDGSTRLEPTATAGSPPATPGCCTGAARSGCAAGEEVTDNELRMFIHATFVL